MTAVYRAPREWTRVHPVSPLLGGWVVMGAVVAALLYNVAPSWTGPDPDVQQLLHTVTRSIFWFVIAVIVILAVTLGVGFLQWKFNEYRLGDEAMYQRKGVIFKQQRQARLDRLQAVDVVQPLLARFFGFAALRIEVAGGTNSGIALEYLRLGDAEALRNELLILAAGAKQEKALEQGADAVAGAAAEDLVAQAEGQAQGPAGEMAADGAATPRPSLRDLAGAPVGVVATPAAPEREIYSVTLQRLLMSLVLSWGFIILLAMPLVAAVAVFGFRLDLGRILAVTVGASLFTIVPAALGILGYFWSQLNRGYGFKASLSEDGIRLRHGLTETRRQTVPPGRVQAVRFSQSLLWRKKDWWRVTINVAGYQDDQDAVSTLLPVGSRQDALTALWLVLPDLGDPDPAGTVSLALSGKGDDGGFTPAPRRARLFDPFQWRHRGVRATERALLMRRGLLVREMFVVPHERTQSLALEQGPLQRTRGLASFTVHSTNGPVRPRADHLDVDDAIALLEAQAQRAAEGRRRQTPEQWMSAVGIRD